MKKLYWARMTMSRSPQERREYEAEKRELRELKRRRMEKRPEKRNGSRPKNNLVEGGVTFRCDVCGYDQQDTMVFEQRCDGTLGGTRRYIICPTCQPGAFARGDQMGFALRTIGPTDKVMEAESINPSLLESMRLRAEGTRKKIF